MLPFLGRPPALSTPHLSPPAPHWPLRQPRICTYTGFGWLCVCMTELSVLFPGPSFRGPHCGGSKQGQSLVLGRVVPLASDQISCHRLSINGSCTPINTSGKSTSVTQGPRFFPLVSVVRDPVRPSETPCTLQSFTVSKQSLGLPFSI